MQDPNNEVLALIIIGSALALLLVGFIITILYLYQRRQQRQEQELALMKSEYEQEILRTQLEMQEQTFKFIAQEIHDNIGQTLSLVKLTLGTLPIQKESPLFETIADSRNRLNKAILDLTDLSRSLHTDRIAQVGLLDSVRMELESMERTGLFLTHSRVHGGMGNLDTEKEIVLYRMAQEIFNNIVKHSKAKNINVDLYYNDHNFVMTIADDGVGFNIDKVRQKGNTAAGVGLQSMPARAKLIQAKVDIDSEPGAGTTITIQVPY